jgi:tetratricopeptide (TPR) repeat protein
MGALADALGEVLAPPRRTRRLGVVLGASAAVALVAALLALRSGARPDPCVAGPDRFDRVLDPARLSALSAPASPSAGGVLAAEAAARRARLAGALIDYRRSWVGGYGEACRATRVRGEQSEELLDRRMICLDERLAGAEEVARLLERGDPGIDERLAGESPLRPVAVCADRARLLAEPREPTDPSARARAEELRAEHARVLALGQAGDYQAALERAEALVAASRALGHGPLIALSALDLGTAERLTGRYPDAARDLEEAALAGEAARDDRVVAEARVRLAALSSATEAADGAAGAGKLVREAEAAVARVGDDVELASWLLDARAGLEAAKGNHAEAEALLVQRVELLQRTPGLDAFLLGSAENNLGVLLMDRQRPDALAHLDRAIAIEAPLLGAHHPQLLMAKFNRASVVAYARPPREQIETAEALIAEVEAASVPNPIFFARVLTLYGNALLSDPARRSEAPAAMARALSLFAAKLSPDHPDRAIAEAQLADVLYENGRAAEAEPHARAYLAFAEGVADHDHLQLRAALVVHAKTLLRMGRARQAREEIERAVSLRTPAAAQWPRAVAREDFVLAGALDETGDHARALVAARAAEAGFLAAPIDDDERLAAVRAWLAARAAPR